MAGGISTNTQAMINQLELMLNPSASAPQEVVPLSKPGSSAPEDQRKLTGETPEQQKRRQNEQLRKLLENRNVPKLVKGGLARAEEAIRRNYDRDNSVMSKPRTGERWRPEYEEEPALEAPMISLEDVAQLGIPTIAKALGGVGALRMAGDVIPAGLRATRSAVKDGRDAHSMFNQPLQFAVDHGQYPKRIDDPNWQRLVESGFNPDRPLLHGSPHPNEGAFIIDPSSKHTYGPAMYAAPVPKRNGHAMSDTFARGDASTVYPLAMKEGKWLRPFNQGKGDDQPGYYDWLENLGMDRQKLAERAQALGYLGVDGGSEIAAFHPSSFAPLYGGEAFAQGGAVSGNPMTVQELQAIITQLRQEHQP